MNLVRTNFQTKTVCSGIICSCLTIIIMTIEITLRLMYRIGPAGPSNLFIHPAVGTFWNRNILTPIAFTCPNSYRAQLHVLIARRRGICYAEGNSWETSLILNIDPVRHCNLFMAVVRLTLIFEEQKSRTAKLGEAEERRFPRLS